MSGIFESDTFILVRHNFYTANLYNKIHNLSRLLIIKILDYGYDECDGKIFIYYKEI